jgi:hypothetical protein
MEYEVRFYFSNKKLKSILQKLQSFAGLNSSGRTFEKTIQYEHPCPEFSFYQKSVDGRFRLRETRGKNSEKCKLSWKRRLPEAHSSEVNREEEVELTIRPEETNNFIFLAEKVLHLEPIESYERYRTIFENAEVEIAVDEYPFGVALEIEVKKSAKEPEKIVAVWVEKLGLKLERAFRLSWDDKYRELCKEQNVLQLKHVAFGAKMPEAKDE